MFSRKQRKGFMHMCVEILASAELCSFGQLFTLKRRNVLHAFELHLTALHDALCYSFVCRIPSHSFQMIDYTSLFSFSCFHRSQVLTHPASSACGAESVNNCCLLLPQSPAPTEVTILELQLNTF